MRNYFPPPAGQEADFARRISSLYFRYLSNYQTKHRNDSSRTYPEHPDPA
jgi:hypothetical protein